MRKLLFAFVSIVFSGCSTDRLLPCEKEGVEGKICREYRYFNGSPQGFVEFDHNGDSLKVSDYYNQNSKLTKTIREHFENGQTIVISEQYPNQDSRIQTWHYNEIDSLEFIVFGANDSIVRIDYELGRRKREAYLNGTKLDRYFEYRYYQDDGKLYRINAYNENDSLLSYRQFEYFSTGQSRITYYTPEHILTGRRLFRTQNGLITSIEFTDSSGTVIEQTDYIYDASSNLIEKTEQVGERTYKSVFLYY
jgi:hypothetical protein